jgi:hypothetical protein
MRNKVCKITIEFLLTCPYNTPFVNFPDMWLIRETPLEKTNYSFASTCQLEIASRSGMNIRSISSSVLETHVSWTCLGPVHSAIVFVNSQVYQSWCVWKTLLHQCPTSLWALTRFLMPYFTSSLYTLSHISLHSEGKNVIFRTSPLGQSVSKSPSLHGVQLWLPVVVFTNCKRIFSDEGWMSPLSVGGAECS